MSIYKPPLTPKRRHADRRGGVAAEQLRGALSEPTQPWASDSERLGRESREKRRAFAVLSQRYARSVPRAWRFAVLVGGVAIAVATWQAMSVAHDLAPFAQNRSAYDGLVREVIADCGEEPCAFGWGRGGEIPNPIRDAMARVRARSVTYDPVLGQVGVDAEYGVDPELVYRSPPTAQQTLWHEHEDRSRARVDSSYSARGRPPRQTEDLGSGWFRRGVRT